MHNAALAHEGIPVRYARLHLLPNELPEALPLLRNAGFLGVNVTIPHKTDVIGLLDHMDEHARKIGAVNTISINEEGITGFNTDGPGLVRALRAEFSVDVRDLRIMVLGAGGGAGKAIATQCAIEHCERLVLVNRTFQKARELAKTLVPFFKGTQLLGPSSRLEAVLWEESALAEQLANVDLVINATSCGMKRTDPPVLPAYVLQPHLMVYDTIYTAHKTPLLADADFAGARTANGLSMLLHQGALAFEIWFNKPAPLEVMREGLLNPKTDAV
jgi:shikimate dehydrogenase